MSDPALNRPPVDPIDAAAAEAIANCGGDPTAAVRALLIELALCRAAVSSGFSRQWHHNRWKIEQQETCADRTP